MNKELLQPYGRVTYQLFDKNGKAKKLFQENALFRFLIKANIVSPTFIKIPVLLGSWVDMKVSPNLVVTAGKALVAQRLGGLGGASAVSHIAVGTGTTSPASGDTTLQTELASSGLTRASATVTNTTVTVTNDTCQATTTFTVTGTQAVTESGLFNASSGGTLLCRQTFSAINVVSGDTLQVTWKVTMA